ncbi:MAG: response regulator [Candidatus Omnitrophica bacterium]|nr:response regulator [Candidatus Omnitrophota bacterium]MCM8777402.1 response regulator [Candidatus Omnitrophota bacterium]
MTENINPQDILSTLNIKGNSENDLKFGTILVIDDELGPRESLRILFKDDYNVITAESGNKGIAELKKHNPDIIILDLKMPEKSGIETLEEIRDIDEKVPVIILTGYGDMESAKKAIHLGAVEFISKPFDVKEMRNIVKKVCEKRFIAKRSERLIADLNILNKKLTTRMTQLENMATIGQLSTEIIHDINNLLSIIYGYTQILVKELDMQNLPDRNKKYIEIIEQEIGRCRHLTSSILELAKAKENIVDTDINIIVKKIVELFENSTLGKNTKFKSHLDKIPLIKADTYQLHQAIVNVILNSIQSMDNPGSITITTGLSKNNIILSIKDTGKGIQEEIIQKITDPFFTSKESGTGLGLAIANRVIRNHNGKLEIKSKPGNGTEVVISLPVK